MLCNLLLIVHSDACTLHHIHFIATCSRSCLLTRPPPGGEHTAWPIGRVGRADRMGLAISLLATVKEKVGQHSSPSLHLSLFLSFSTHTHTHTHAHPPSPLHVSLFLNTHTHMPLLPPLTPSWSHDHKVIKLINTLVHGFCFF